MCGCVYVLVALYTAWLLLLPDKYLHKKNTCNHLQCLFILPPQPKRCHYKCKQGSYKGSSSSPRQPTNICTKKHLRTHNSERGFVEEQRKWSGPVFLAKQLIYLHEVTTTYTGTYILMQHTGIYTNKQFGRAACGRCGTFALLVCSSATNLQINISNRNTKQLHTSTEMLQLSIYVCSCLWRSSGRWAKGQSVTI